MKSLVWKWSKLTRGRHEMEPPQINEENIMFMIFIVRMNLRQRGWHKPMIRIMRCVEERSFKLDGDGITEVSGLGDPMVLWKTIESLKKQGKDVELCWLQYGKCSSYLFWPSGNIANGVPRPQPRPSSNNPTSATARAPATGKAANGSVSNNPASANAQAPAIANEANGSVSNKPSSANAQAPAAGNVTKTATKN